LHEVEAVRQVALVDDDLEPSEGATARPSQQGLTGFGWQGREEGELHSAESSTGAAPARWPKRTMAPRVVRVCAT